MTDASNPVFVVVPGDASRVCGNAPDALTVTTGTTPAGYATGNTTETVFTVLVTNVPVATPASDWIGTLHTVPSYTASHSMSTNQARCPANPPAGRAAKFAADKLREFRLSRMCRFIVAAGGFSPATQVRGVVQAISISRFPVFVGRAPCMVSGVHTPTKESNMKKVFLAAAATVALVLAPAAADASPKHKTHKAKTVRVWSGGVVPQPVNQKWIYTPRF